MSGAPERSQAFSTGAGSAAYSRLSSAGNTSQTDICLDFLNEILGSLPTSVTVQDECGNFLFVNDAAAAQFNVPAEELLAIPAGQSLPSTELNDRRDFAVAALQSDLSRMSEETVRSNYNIRTFLTAHRPARVGSRKFLLSSSIDFTEHRAIQDELFRCAYYDELTGLPTRRVIEQRANTLIRQGSASPSGFALAFLDIDNFKHINDYYGHASGDALLVEVARRLSLGLRDTDMLSRISGDEFLLLLNPVQRSADVAGYIENLLQKLKAPFFIDGSELFASASIGVSLFPDHGSDYETLRQNADIAMYRIKNETKGAAALFDESMQREALARMEIEQQLRLAILDKRFCCAFQPKVDIRTRKVKGIEALVRLRSDEGLLQAPGEFINLAVELGLIDELTHLVLAEIVKSIDLIDAEFGPDVTISINVAAKQACNLDFMTSFAAAIEATGCPTRFIVEVTEDAFVAKTQFQTEILPILRRLGVGVSIDDFGIGYSSLSALADITADEIKIDRSFIIDIHKRPRSQGILRAIESLSEALGMTVIAEGVETPEELTYLQAATRIRYAQGFYFSKPVFLEELSRGSRGFSESRTSTAGRPAPEARPAYSRAHGFGR